MAGVQAMKRIPLIKFPQRHPKPSGSTSQPLATSTAGDAKQILFTGSNFSAAPSNMALGGKASAQPKRTPMSKEEMEAILLGGCF